jgi:hypothetical protein
MELETYPDRVTLFKLPAYPNENEIVITNTAHSVGQLDAHTVFLLDFSRPLEKKRRFGFTVALSVPVIHQSEEVGGFVIGCFAADPYFKDLKRFWKQYYPSNKNHRLSDVGGLVVIADFATHFPAFCQ